MTERLALRQPTFNVAQTADGSIDRAAPDSCVGWCLPARRLVAPPGHVGASRREVSCYACGLSVRRFHHPDGRSLHSTEPS